MMSTCEQEVAVHIEEWQPQQPDLARKEKDLNDLAEVLHATVHAGASVSFVLPFSVQDAWSFWHEKVLPKVLKKNRRVLIARSDGEILGTVQLELKVPPNQCHRAEVMKLLVHPKARRRGIARMLMSSIEEIARLEGRTLLTLDTRRDDMAEPLYLSMGFVLAGIIPRYARGPFSRELEDTSFMYKELR